jgi:site-specific recombinase XerD
MITMKNWRESMSEDMRLRDLRPRTLEAYLLATRLFLECIGKPPEALTEADIRGYILHLRDEKRQAPSSINIAICALRFFFNFTLQRDYEVFALLRVNRPRTLPVVLSRAEVKRLLGAVQHPVRRMALTTIYALGLRLGEGLHLQSSHIDSARQMVWVRSGKGAKDRRVPLPKPLLHKLRQYWKNERPVSTLPLLFVSAEGKPIHETTLQKTFTAAQLELNLPRRATIHTLRHSYATHLVEHGISLRTIQDVLGHKSLHTTEVYMHVTVPGTERLQAVLDQLMADL